MNKLLILAFILYAFPSHAVIIDTVVCSDHVKRTTSVYRNAVVSDYVAELPFEVANDYICMKLKKVKRNKRGK